MDEANNGSATDATLEEFRAHGLYEKGWSDETIRLYAQRAKQADGWLREERGTWLGDASTADLLAWLDSEIRDVKTFNVYRVALVGYFGWLAHEGRRDDNPAEAIPRRNPHDDTGLSAGAVDAVGRYVDVLFGEGLADRTVENYTRTLRRYLRWCERFGVDPVDLTPTELRQFVETVKLVRSQRVQLRSVLRRWFETNDRHDNPWKAVRVPPKPRMFSKAMAEDDVRRLLRAAQMVGGRQALAVTACLYTAARASEVAAFRWDGWDRDEGLLTFERPKSGDWHTVPVHPELADRLGFILDQGVPSQFVFAGDGGRAHVQAQTIWSWVRDVGTAAGLDVSPHKLRHTALTTALDSTGDLRAVQELAGHRDPATTAGYTRRNAKRVAAAVASLDYLSKPVPPPEATESERVAAWLDAAIPTGDGFDYHDQPL